MTGMGGFMGRHVAAALRSRGAEVRDARCSGKYDFLKADDRAEALKDVYADTLVHLAWVTKHREFWTSDLNQAWETATIDLVSRFFASGGRRVIATGTCAEYSWIGGGVFSESAPLAPHTAYGSAKARTGERLIQLAEKNGASAVWGRIFFPFGIGEPTARLISSMLRACLKEEPVSCGPPDTVRDFWDVRNLGDALASLVFSDLSGPINIASGKGTSFGELGMQIQKIAGVSGMIRFGERPRGIDEPPVIIADTTRLQHELGFFESISLETGLSDYYETLR